MLLGLSSLLLVQRLGVQARPVDEPTARGSVGLAPSPMTLSQAGVALGTGAAGTQEFTAASAPESRKAFRSDPAGRARDLTAALDSRLAKGGALLAECADLLRELRETNEKLWFDPSGDFRSTREEPAPLSKVTAVLAKRQTPVQVGCGLLARMNGLADPNIVPGHRKLRAPVDSLSVVVRRDSFSLVLYLGAFALDAYPVGIGKGETPTPAGDFEIREVQRLDRLPRKDTVWTRPEDGKLIYFGDAEYPFGKRFLRFAPPFEHYGIHGTDTDAAIGSAVSHGCVRMKNGDVERLAALLDPVGPCRVRVRIE